MTTAVETRPTPSALGDGVAMAVAAGGAAVVGLASWVVVARWLPPADVGRATAFVAAFLLVAGCTDLNLGVGLLRWLPRAGTWSATLLGRSLLAVSALSTLVAVIYLLVPGSAVVLEAAPGWPGSPALAVGCFVAACVAWGLFQQQDFVLVALGRAWWAPARIGLFALARLAVLVGGPLTATLVVWSWLAPSLLCVLLTLAATWWWVRRPGLPEPGGSLPTRRDVLGFLGPTYVGHIGVGALGHLVPLAVTVRVGPALGAPFFLVWQAIVVVDVVAQYFVSSLVSAVAREPERAPELTRATRRRLVLGLTPLLLLGLPLAGPALSLFGPSYAAHASVLGLMLVATIPRLLVIVRLGEHQAHGRGVRFAVLALTNAVAVVGVVVTLPLDGSAGGADPLTVIAVGYLAVQGLLAAATLRDGRTPSTTPVADAASVEVAGEVAGGVPAVSVCLPLTGTSGPDPETVRSVLAQTHADLELIVLCRPRDRAATFPGFDDDRVRLASAVRARSAAELRNAAVALARAPLVKLVEDGDLLHPRCLELQGAALRADAGLAVVAARRHLVDGHRRIVLADRFLRGLLGPRTRSALVRRAVRAGADPVGPLGGVTFRRAAFAAAGGLRDGEGLAGVPDLDLVVRLTRHGGFRGQRETLSAHPLVLPDPDGPGGRRADAGRHRRALRRAPGGRVRRGDVLVGALAVPVARATRRWVRLTAPLPRVVPARGAGGDS